MMLFELQLSCFPTNIYIYIYDLIFVSLQEAAKQQLLEEGGLFRKRIMEEDGVAGNDLLSRLGFRPWKEATKAARRSGAEGTKDCKTISAMLI